MKVKREEKVELDWFEMGITKLEMLKLLVEDQKMKKHDLRGSPSYDVKA